ncbi:hypothetical protein Ancab_017239 [Ancistrocladus abbreviatus]
MVQWDLEMGIQMDEATDGKRPRAGVKEGGLELQGRDYEAETNMAWHNRTKVGRMIAQAKEKRRRSRIELGNRSQLEEDWKIGSRAAASKVVLVCNSGERYCREAASRVKR